MSSCGSPLAVAAAIAEAEQAAKKALADALANGGIGGVNPDELAAAVAEAVANAVPPLVANEVPTVLNDILTPQIQQITSNATNQAASLATQAAVSAVQSIITNLSQQLAATQTTITTLNQQIALLKRGEIPYNQLRPKNGTYISVTQISFAGKVTGFVALMGTGAGTAACSVPVNGTFQAGDDILITISGATAASRNLVTNLYFERV